MPAKRSRFKTEFVADASAALNLARARGILPTSLDTAGIREAFTQDTLARSVFSARTTHASYLQSLGKQIEKVLEGREPATARRVLKMLLTRAGYSPDTGFAGDAALGIPPARPGSIRDLSSNARLDLILETQVALLQGRAQQIAGNAPAALDLFPGYELVRAEPRRAPRDWLARWKQAGGKVRRDKGRVRLVALKGAEIWSILGDPAFFGDALGVSHPPFCFRSGMAWEELDRKECVKLKLLKKEEKPKAPKRTPKPLPPAVASTRGLSPRMREALGRGLREIEAQAGRLVQRGSAATDDAPPPPPPGNAAWLKELSRATRAEFNALLELAAA